MALKYLRLLPARMQEIAHVQVYENSGKSWSSSEKAVLAKLAGQNTPTRVIGLKLGRTEDAVRSMASKEGVSLKPTNQSPYTRKK